MHSSLQDLVKSPFKHSKKINWFYSDIRFFKSKKLVNKTHNQRKACDITIFVSKTTIQITEIYSKMIIDNAICICNMFDYPSIGLKAHEPIFNVDSLQCKKNIFVSAGRLFFSTDVGGIREMLIHNETGLIVSCSKKGLKEAMKKFILSEGLTNYIKHNQREIDFDLHNKNIIQKIQYRISYRRQPLLMDI